MSRMSDNVAATFPKPPALNKFKTVKRYIRLGANAYMYIIDCYYIPMSENVVGRYLGADIRSKACRSVLMSTNVLLQTSDTKHIRLFNEARKKQQSHVLQHCTLLASSFIAPASMFIPRITGILQKSILKWTRFL